MLCCGHDRTTAFCSTCGRKLTPDGSLPSLLLYCRERLGEAREAYGAVSGNRVDSGRLDRLSHRVAKWEAWCATLENLILGTGEDLP